MSKSAPHPVDQYVGMRVRIRRNLRNVSQERLGEHLGVTFQQIQKYEKGTNRISASRLWEIAKVLQVPVAYFFDGYDFGDAATAPGFAEADQSQLMMDFLKTNEGMKLVRSFTSIPNPQLRRSILDHIDAIAHGGPSQE